MIHFIAAALTLSIFRSLKEVQIHFERPTADESMLLVWRRGNQEPMIEEYVNYLADLLD